MMTEKNKKDIINFDTQGWPLYKLNLRDLISKICKYDKSNKKFYIEDDNPILDLYPSILEDDGMGYGVRERKIIEINVHPEPDYRTNAKFCNLFVEFELPNIDIWHESKFYANAFVQKDGIEYITRDIKKEDDELLIFCESYDDKQKRHVWIKERELEWVK